MDREQWLRQFISAAKERAEDQERHEKRLAAEIERHDYQGAERPSTGQPIMYSGTLNRFTTKKRGQVHGVPPPPSSGRSPPGQGRAATWSDWIFLHGLVKRTGCVISCLGLLGMLSLAVQHWGMLPLVKNMRFQKQAGNASIAGARTRWQSSKMANAGIEHSKQSAAGGPAVLAALNRSRTADPEAGAQCVGFAVAKDRDIAAGDVGSIRVETVVRLLLRYEGCFAFESCCGKCAWNLVRPAL